MTIFVVIILTFFCNLALERQKAVQVREAELQHARLEFEREKAEREHDAKERLEKEAVETSKAKAGLEAVRSQLQVSSTSFLSHVTTAHRTLNMSAAP